MSLLMVNSMYHVPAERGGSYSPEDGEGWQLLEVKGEVEAEACLEEGRDGL